MGDRANVYVKNYNGGGVYLYTHWCGSELPMMVQTALARKMRWSDEAYLTRIIFDSMTAGQRDQETGFGIASYLCDNEYRIIVVDCSEQTISFANEDLAPQVTWTFEDYIKFSEEDINEHWKSRWD